MNARVLAELFRRGGWTVLVAAGLVVAGCNSSSVSANLPAIPTPAPTSSSTATGSPSSTPTTAPTGSPIVTATPAPSPSPTLNPIVANPSALSFTNVGATYAQTVYLSETGYTGAFSLQTSCTIVTISVATIQSYVVVPVSNGSCQMTFEDSHGQTAVVPVTVNGPVVTPTPSAAPTATAAPPTSSPHPIVAVPVSLTFNGIGAGYTESVTLSEQGYSGGFSLETGCPIVNVTAVSSVAFNVVPVSSGSCGLIFNDLFQQTITVPTIVTVTNIGGQ